LPARSHPRSQRDRRPNATNALGRRRHTSCRVITLLGVVAWPVQAAAADEIGQAASLALIAAGAALAFFLIIVLSLGVNALLRRTRRDAEEVRRLGSLLDVLDEGVAVCTGMQAVAVNISLCRLIGIAPADANHLMLSSFVGDSDVIDRLLSEEALRLETEITNRAGDTVAVEIAARTIPYGEGTARLLEIRDVGERKDTQERVSFLAHHDPLTSLPNRELMRARLNEAVERATANGSSFAVLWIDLDHFKDINDIHGHLMGDQILRIVA